MNIYYQIQQPLENTIVFDKLFHFDYNLGFFTSSGNFPTYYYLIRFGLKNEFFDNTKLIVGFIIYFILVWIILYLLNIFYIYRNLKRNDKRTNKAYGKYLIRMNDKQIESDFNNQKIVYKWIDISKVKIRKKYFFIRTKNDFIGLTFRKDMLKDDYQKILD